MTFRIRGPRPRPVPPAVGPAGGGARRRRRRAPRRRPQPGFPDRVELRDAVPGETLLLINYLHRPAANPYRASHAIFVREGAGPAYDRVGEIPPALATGGEQREVVARLLGDPRIAYLQAHYARPGCYAARIERA